MNGLGASRGEGGGSERPSWGGYGVEVGPIGHINLPLLGLAWIGLASPLHDGDGFMHKLEWDSSSWAFKLEAKGGWLPCLVTPTKLR